MSEFSENTVILSLDCHKPGKTKQVDEGEVTVSATTDEERKLEQRRLKVSKRIWESPELDAIDQHMGKVKRYVADQALPVKTIKAGMHAIEAGRIPTVVNTLRRFVDELQPLKDDFEAAYPRLIEETYADLGPIVEPTDFKPIEVLLDQISITWQMLTFDVPAKVLGKISAALVEEEQQKIVAHTASMTDQLETALAVAVSGVIEHLTERLKPGKDGKPRKISDAAVEKYNRLLGDVLSQNVTHNERLAGIVEQAQAVINAATPAELSTNKGVRQTVLQSMERLAQEMGELTVTKTGRKIIVHKPTAAAPITVAGEEAHGAEV